MRRTSTLLGAATTATVAVAALGPAAAGANTSNTAALKPAGETRLTLDKKAGAALKSLGIRVAPVSPSKVAGGAVVFPITSGSVDPKLTDGALVNHSGGLRLTKGRTTVALRNFRIRITGSQATISAAVGTARATIINLDLANAKASRPAMNLRVRNVGAKLNATGASALNKAFRTSAFKSGLKLGTAVVNARFAQFIVESGDTKLTLDPATLGAITGAGYTPAIVTPATLAGTVATFPIVKSKIAADLTSGAIGHAGGLSLTKSGTTTSATDFDIKLSASPTLAALINGAPPKADILNLDLANLRQTVAGQTVTLDGVTAKVNTTLANALGLPSADGATLGTAVVTANIR
ncbi:MAG TPA: HtaA domain-containing protein [Casimicrobiaceae bacterium]